MACLLAYAHSLPETQEGEIERAKRSRGPRDVLGVENESSLLVVVGHVGSGSGCSKIQR